VPDHPNFLYAVCNVYNGRFVVSSDRTEYLRVTSDTCHTSLAQTKIVWQGKVAQVRLVAREIKSGTAAHCWKSVARIPHDLRVNVVLANTSNEKWLPPSFLRSWKRFVASLVLFHCMFDRWWLTIVGIVSLIIVEKFDKLVQGPFNHLDCANGDFDRILDCHDDYLCR
jgi:hypothetical protein